MNNAVNDIELVINRLVTYAQQYANAAVAQDIINVFNTAIRVTSSALITSPLPTVNTTLHPFKRLRRLVSQSPDFTDRLRYQISCLCT